MTPDAPDAAEDRQPRVEVGAITVHLIRDTDDELYDAYKAIKAAVGDDERTETRLNLGVRPRMPRGQALGR